MLSQVGGYENSGSESGEPPAAKFVSDGNECDAPFYSQLICSCWRTSQGYWSREEQAWQEPSY